MSVDVEKKIDAIEENPITHIDESAIGGQVELAVNPNEPEVMPSDSERTSEEKAEDTKFEKEMEEIKDESIPEVTALLDGSNGFSEDSFNAMEPRGFNPDSEAKNLDIVQKAIDAAEPTKAEFVQTDLVDGDSMLSAKPEEYVFHDNEVLVEREEDEDEDITGKVSDIKMIEPDGIHDVSTKVTKEFDPATGDNENTLKTASIESDLEDAAKKIDVLIEGMDSTPGVTIEDNPEVFGETFEKGEMNKNSAVGEIVVDELHVITPDGAGTIDGEVKIPTISETPLDHLDETEVAHVNTLSDVDLDAKVASEVRSLLGTEDTDLHLGIVDGNQVVEKGSSGEPVITGDFTTIVMGTVAEANKGLDGDSLKEFEITSGDPDQHVCIDETPQIEKAEGSKIVEAISGFEAEEYYDAFDSFINNEDAEYIDE